MDKVVSNNDEANENTEKEKKIRSERDEWVSSIIIAVIAALVIRVFIFAPTIVKGPSMEPTLYEGHRLIAERVSYFLNIKPHRGDVITFSEPHSLFYQEKDPVKKLYDFFMKRDYIKRVIGAEGDHVQIRSDNIRVDGQVYDNYEIKGKQVFVDGKLLTGSHIAVMDDAKVYINGVKQEEDYIKEPWHADINIENGKISPTRYINGMIGNEDLNLDLVVPKGYVFVMGDNRNNSSDSRKFSPLKNDFTNNDGCVSLKEMSGRVIFRFWPLNNAGALKR